MESIKLSCRLELRCGRVTASQTVHVGTKSVSKNSENNVVCALETKTNTVKALPCPCFCVLVTEIVITKNVVVKDVF